MVDAGLRVVQVSPSSTEYSMLVAAAPLSAPSVNATEAEASPRVIEEMLGAAATVAGVPVTEVLAVPAPWAFTARSFTW